MADTPIETAAEALVEAWPVPDDDTFALDIAIPEAVLALFTEEA